MIRRDASRADRVMIGRVVVDAVNDERRLREKNPAEEQQAGRATTPGAEAGE
jgi:hypothetical protein